MSFNDCHDPRLIDPKFNPPEPHEEGCVGRAFHTLYDRHVAASIQGIRASGETYIGEWTGGGERTLRKSVYGHPVRILEPEAVARMAHRDAIAALDVRAAAMRSDEEMKIAREIEDREARRQAAVVRNVEDRCRLAGGAMRYLPDAMPGDVECPTCKAVFNDSAGRATSFVAGRCCAEKLGRPGWRGQPEFGQLRPVNGRPG